MLMFSRSEGKMQQGDPGSLLCRN